MRLQDLPLEAMAELNSLAEKKVNINDQTVKTSIFYQKIQNEVELDAHRIWNALSPEGMLLLAKIVANSPTLRSIDMSWNRLGEYGPVIAAELAKSPSLQSINISHNELREYSSAIAAELAKSPSLQSIDMGSNWLDNFDRLPMIAIIKAHNNAHKFNVKLNKDLHEALDPMLLDDIVNIVSDYIIPETAHIDLKF